MSRPLVSVVIPTYNRLAILRRVLEAYEHQEPAELRFEVVVVNDGSTDGTRDFLSGFRSPRYRCRVDEQENGGPARARNRALELAQGDLILFTGDDVEPAPDLLLQHCRGHRNRQEPGAAILGLVRWSEDAKVTATMRHIDGVGAQQFSYSNFTDAREYDFRHFYTSNVSIRRAFLDREPSYFSTEFPAAAFEDAELAWRLAGHGLRIYYHAAAVAHHHHPYAARSFFQRQQRCGEMAAMLYRKVPELEKWLGLRQLEWCRLRSLTTPRLEVARELGAWEHRMICVGAFCDLIDVAAADSVLLALFDYGYQRGLACALYGEESARRVCARLLVESFPPAVAEFRRIMDNLGLPWPAADVLALETLATDA